MSDNEDLLGDDLGDQSLADYNLGNEEEEQLLADDYDNSASQNVPTSGVDYRESGDMVPPEYSSHNIEYVPQQNPYPAATEECVVPNITVEVPNVSLPEHSTYAPYQERPVYDNELAVVPPPIPAAPVESPQIVPSEVTVPLSNGDLVGNRERFTSERPPGVQRMPQVRDIPDSLDKVYVPSRGGFVNRGRNSWVRNTQYRSSHPYRRNNAQRANFPTRSSFPPQMRSHPPPIRPNIPEIRQEIAMQNLPPSPERILPERMLSDRMLPDRMPLERMLPERMLPERMLPERMLPERMLPERMPPERMLPERILPENQNYRPMDRPYQNYPRFSPPFRSEEFRPSFEPRPFQYNFNRSPFNPREIAPSSVNIPQVTIRQSLPVLPVMQNLPKMDKFPPKVREPEVRMLPVQLPPNLPPGGLAGKKVLINPHFKGNFQPPVEGLPTYIPTRIQKTPPPLSPTLESKFGPIKDIDDAAERFIAEQRNALARAASRKAVRRSPQRYIENTTIEIENELARRNEDEELLRRQEEFINANRAGLRRRMRSASPPPARRSPSPPRRSPRRTRHDPPDEESEYRRRLREQESLRERVLRAKEMRRRRNAVATHAPHQHGEREKVEKDKETAQIPLKVENTKPETVDNKPTSTQPDKMEKVEKIEKIEKPDTTRKSPEKLEQKSVVRERSPIKNNDAVVNSTCENLTPPREKMPQKEKRPSPERDLTPPLPGTEKESKFISDDELDLILDDIDDILSDEDSGRFKEKKEETKQKPAEDLRSKLAPKPPARPQQRQKIVFNESSAKDSNARKTQQTKEKSPIRRTIVTSSTKADDDNSDKKSAKTKQKTDTSAKSRARIIFDKKESESPEEKPKQAFSNRRVVLQRAGGIFGRAVRTALNSRSAKTKVDSPHIEYGSDSDDQTDVAKGMVAMVTNLPHGITDTRLRTLAGDNVQSLILDKEERSAKITFKTSTAADNFRRKFNNKMVAASRLTVSLR